MDDLFVQTTGTGGEPVVLLHGFAGSGEIWHDIQSELGPLATCHAVDLPGHAGSMGYPGAGPAKVAVGAVLNAMTRRGVETFHICGHSFGGAVATLIAMTAPQRVRSLTLLAPGGFGPEINIRLLKRFAAAREAEPLRIALEGMTGFLHAVSDDTVDFHVRMRARPGQTELLVAFAEGLARNGRQGSIPREQLSTLTMPVRVLWGLQDNVLPARQAEGLPDAWQVDRLSETGHMLVEEVPEAVAAALRAQITR